MTESTLGLRGVTKRFLDGRVERVILRDVDLDVPTGQVVGLRGRSGCGKTTLLKLAAGLLVPDAGTVRIAQTVLEHDRPAHVARARRDHVGLVLQSYGLLDDESALDNVVLPLMFRQPRPDAQARRAAFDRALSAAALDVRPYALVSTLSGGEKQRLALARALVCTPSVIVADEPTAALDTESGAAITARLRAVADSGVGVLVATHDPQVADACDVIYEFRGPEVHLI